MVACLTHVGMALSAGSSAVTGAGYLLRFRGPRLWRALWGTRA